MKQLLLFFTLLSQLLLASAFAGTGATQPTEDTNADVARLTAIAAKMNRPLPLLPQEACQLVVRDHSANLSPSSASNSNGQHPHSLLTHEPVSILAHFPNVKTNQEYVEAVSETLHHTSEELTQEIQNATASHHPVIVDILGIGAGPQAAMAFSALKQTNPALSTVILEASNRAGIFDKMFKSFRVNTTINNFVASPFQPADFNFTRDPYAPAESIGAATLMTHHLSDARVLFNQKVVGVDKEPAGETWPAKYKVRTEKGLVIYTHGIIQATGFGDADAKSRDAETQQLLARKKQEADAQLAAGNLTFNPGIETVDNFLLRASEQARQSHQNGPKVTEALPSRVMVVGAGDGGKIAVEAVLGYAESIKGSAGKAPAKVIWAGQSADTELDYIDSLGSFGPRYSDIGVDFSRTIWPEPGKVTSIREIQHPQGHPEFAVKIRPENRREQMDLFFSQVFGIPLSPPSLRDQLPEKEVTVDHIIYATGYSEVKGLYQNVASGNLRPQPVSGSISDYTVNSNLPDYQLGGQLSGVNGAENIWNIGNNSNSFTDVGPLHLYGVVGAGSVTLLGPRSAALGAVVARKVTAEKQENRAETQLPGGKSMFSRSEKLSGNYNKVAASAVSAPVKVVETESKVRIASILKNLRFPRGKASFSIEKSRDDLNVTSRSFTAESLGILAQEIQKNPGFLSFIFPYLSKVKKLEIKLEAKSDGTIKLENFNISLDN